MNMLRLQCPVYTLDKELLFPKGTVLSASTIDILVSPEKSASQKKFSLFRHGTVKKDIRHYLGRPPYDMIFSAKEKITALLDLMSKVHLPRPLLHSLDYFYQSDFDTYRHTLMVFALSVLLANDLIQDKKKLIQEISTGPTHDIGKVCVPLPILKKNIPLTRNELGILRHHSAAGYVLLCHYLHDARSLAAKIARDHHERRDASGYPRGIHLNDHMVEIIATCDVYDALVSPRPYRPCAYDNRAALEEITAMAERNEIGWSVVRALVAHYRKAKIHYSEARISSEKRGIPPPDNLHGTIADEGEQS